VFSVSFSSNDAVGHRYGPDSPEVHDVTVKTDAVVGALLGEVDRLVGLQHTAVIFTTDHGVAPMPEVAVQQRLPAGRFKGQVVTDAVQEALAARFGPGQWILSSGSSVYLDLALISASGLDAALVRRVAADAARAVPNVARVYTREQLLDGHLPDERISQRVARSYHPVRSGDLEVVLDPYWIRGSSNTTHGSPYGYDAHIPLILMGPGFTAGMHHQHAALNDVAPTLAALLGVGAPAGASGRVLAEALTPARSAGTTMR
jgi:arylsulfatase A-like enzyme